MIEYIYFVKCPNCEDEPFTLFDEAKNFALGRMSEKPIITQIEVDRNDFGECTDSCDLGTVWSWEDMMTDTEKETAGESALLTKDFLNSLDPENDPEFATIDNSVDFEPVTSEVSAACDELIESSADFDFENDSIEALWVAENLNGGEIVAACWADSEDLAHRLLSQAFRERTGGDLRDCYIREAEADEPDYITDNPELLAEALTEDFDRVKAAAQCSRNCYDFYNAIAAKVSDKEIKPYAKAAAKFVKDNYGLTGDEAEELLWSGYIVWKQLHESSEKARKPIPEGMTIEQLVEEMEENEDTVECTWCEELFDKSECRKEVDLGWLCSRCEAAIKSRGETLTFRENNYWDFLDEKLDLDIDFSQVIDSSDMEIWGIEPISENTYKAVLMKRFENVSFRGFDEIEKVEAEMFDIGGLFVFHFGKDGLPKLGRWDPALLNSLGNCEIVFDDERYDQAVEETLNGSASKREELDPEELHDLGNKDYPDETPEVSDSHLRLCPECGKETFDLETGICVDCGFN